MRTLLPILLLTGCFSSKTPDPDEEADTDTDSDADADSDADTDADADSDADTDSDMDTDIDTGTPPPPVDFSPCSDATTTGLVRLEIDVSGFGDDLAEGTCGTGLPEYALTHWALAGGTWQARISDAEPGTVLTVQSDCSTVADCEEVPSGSTEQQIDFDLFAGEETLVTVQSASSQTMELDVFRLSDCPGDVGEPDNDVRASGSQVDGTPQISSWHNPDHFLIDVAPGETPTLELTGPQALDFDVFVTNDDLWPQFSFAVMDPDGVHRLTIPESATTVRWNVIVRQYDDPCAGYTIDVAP